MPVNKLSRRNFLAGSGACATLPLLPNLPARAGELKTFLLKAAPAKVRLAPQPFPETGLWCFNGTTPGSEIRVRHGERVRIVVENGIPDVTSVHWHGVRVPNAMDGVAYLTQPPIAEGGRHVYEFTPPDAGTFWYHPHVHSVVQTNKGLYGAFIVEENEPITVDRELTWVLGDWRLGTDAQMRDNFASERDYLRAGRIGNVVTLNGQVGGRQTFRSGERVRFRLLNACDARIFALRFHQHKVRVIALDGQPVEPFEPAGGVVLAPAQRADIVVDFEHKPGSRFPILDTFYPQTPYELVEMAYSDEAPIRTSPLDASIRLAPNSIPTPDLGDALALDAVLEGGDMGSLEKALVDGVSKDRVEMLAMGRFWAINGIASFHNHQPQPLFSAKLGQSVVVTFRNNTAWPHPMHLHGHSFRVLEHNGQTMQLGHVVDTVLLGSGEISKVAFVADNLGDWMIHCHILGHADAGMMGTFRVG